MRCARLTTCQREKLQGVGSEEWHDLRRSTDRRKNGKSQLRNAARLAAPVMPTGSATPAAPRHRFYLTASSANPDTPRHRFYLTVSSANPDAPRPVSGATMRGRSGGTRRSVYTCLVLQAGVGQRPHE
jgi:hypothetical protein